MNQEETYPTINDEALKGFEVIVDGELLGHVRIELVGEVAAGVMLEKNDVNRNERSRRIDGYARDMERQEWPWLGDPIRLDRADQVADGQHRLRAVQKARVTLPFLVISGMKPDAQAKMDQGAARSAADALKLLYRDSHVFAGHTWQRISAIARRTWCYDHGSYADGGAVNPTASDIIEFTEGNLDLLQPAEKIGWRAQRHAGMTGGVVGAAFLVCARIDERAANLFFDQVVDGEDIRSGMPAFTLRGKLQYKDRLGGRRLMPADMFRFILRAWNAYRDGEQLDRLITPKDGWTAKNSPVAK